MALLMAYASSQAKELIWATAATYTTVFSNTKSTVPGWGSNPGLHCNSSGCCSGFLTRCATAGTPDYILLLFILLIGPHPHHGSFQARGSNQSHSGWPAPQPQQRRIWATSATYTTAHSNTRSLTHWLRPRIEPESSWILVGLINCWATKGMLQTLNS